MTKKYASGKHALGICDRCGLTYKLNELKYEVENYKRTGFRVCRNCLDPDHPQDHLGRYKWDDPQALENARPDTAQQGPFAWNPVGTGNAGTFGAEDIFEMSLELGTVTVTTE